MGGLQFGVPRAETPGMNRDGTIDPTDGPTRRARRRLPRAPAVLGALALLSACGSVSVAGPSSTTPAPATVTASAGGYSKVLVIMEENETYSGIIGSRHAPYLNKVAKKYGYATKVDAGYPAKCPSLAAYVMLTSGSDRGICDDRPPAEHLLGGDSVFSQVARNGGRWRTYAEDMPVNCALANSGKFAVRHTPSNYYVDLRLGCLFSSLPMGSINGGTFRGDVDAGTLPHLSFLIPNICNDMHGGSGCPKDAVRTGDSWLRTVLPAVLAGPDYKAGRLAIVIAWDEGTKKNNHIPLVVVSPTTSHRVVKKAATLCSVLATVSDVLGVDRLGCAARAASLASAFRL